VSGLAEPLRRSILLVHGHNCQPAEDVFREVSLAALRSGIERDYPEMLAEYDALDKEFVYYGDVSNRFLQGLGQTYDEQLDVGDRLHALEELRKLTARKKFGLRQYDGVRGKSAVPEAVADVIAPLCALVGLTMPLLRIFVPDFAEYLRGTDLASTLRQRVREMLIELLLRGDTVMVISHGTGCAVAWDVLWQLSHDERYRDAMSDSKVDAWVTLGSPLGDRGVQKYLLGAGRQPHERYPGNLITWHNLSAEDDYICHDKTVADDFRPMMRDRIISSINDYRIYNHALRYGKSSPHTLLGYLIHPRLAKIVTDWMKPVAEI
jgi:hypothetical protein